MNRQHPVFLTIITRNYYHWARTWASSVLQHHPEADVVVAIADTPSQGHIDLFPDCQILSIPEEAESIGLNQYRRMAFQYTPFELTCALKPFVIRYLSGEYANVIYLDADTCLYRRLDEVVDYLKSNEVVLTPHRLTPGSMEQEKQIRAAGVLNGGFLGCSKSKAASEFLNWWADRCRFDCYVDPYAGNFVDQSWLDLAPSYFEGCRVLRDDGLNVAYWNLDERSIRFNHREVLVNDHPLGFFHFSGLDPEQQEQISRFDNSKMSPDVARLKQQYVERLTSNRTPDLEGQNCEYATFQCGKPIPDTYREAIRMRYPEFIDVENPFDSEGNVGLLDRFESVRERLYLARKHWQIEELQRLADQQTEWIRNKSQNKLGRRVVRAFRNVCQAVTARGTASGKRVAFPENSGAKPDAA